MSNIIWGDGISQDDTEVFFLSTYIDGTNVLAQEGEQKNDLVT